MDNATESLDLLLVLQWAEKAGVENLKQRIDSAGLLQKEAVLTLAVMSAAMGGAMPFAVRVLDPLPAPAAWAALAGVAYFSLLALLLVWSCLWVVNIPTALNEPKNLAQPQFTLAALLEVELENIQARIDEVAARNAERAARLNWIRLLAALSPAPLAAVAWLAR